MSTPVVTTAGSASCGHEGTVALAASQPLLTVAGASALVVDDIKAAQISGCTTPTNADKSLLPCLVTTPPTAGESLLLRIGGRPALLSDAAGKTTGTVGPGSFGVYSVSAPGQNLLVTT